MFICISWSILLSGLIPALITAIILIGGYYFQLRSFDRQIKTQNDIARKANNVTVILKLEDQFNALNVQRSSTAKKIISSGLLLDDKPISNYQSQVGYDIEDIYDFFDTLGFLIIKEYLAADVAWNYFDHWFISYYGFFKKYGVKSVSEYESTVWNNLERLKEIFDKIESENKGSALRNDIKKSDLAKFFEEESIPE
jgi:hypothetical protein